MAEQRPLGVPGVAVVLAGALRRRSPHRQAEAARRRISTVGWVQFEMAGQGCAPGGQSTRGRAQGCSPAPTRSPPKLSPPALTEAGVGEDGDMHARWLLVLGFRVLRCERWSGCSERFCEFFNPEGAVPTCRAVR